MEAEIARGKDIMEFPTEERCYISEIWNTGKDSDVSIAKARVEPGITTEKHALNRDFGDFGDVHWIIG